MTRKLRLQKADLTIVGGQPDRERAAEPSADVAIPTGLERLLREACADRAFRERLLANRGAALAECGVELSPSERATLQAITDDVLKRMIEAIAPDGC